MPHSNKQLAPEAEGIFVVIVRLRQPQDLVDLAIKLVPQEERQHPHNRHLEPPPESDRARQGHIFMKKNHDITFDASKVN